MYMLVVSGPISFPSLSLFLVYFLRAGDAGGGNAPSTKEVTAGRGTTDPAHSNGTIVEGGSEHSE